MLEFILSFTLGSSIVLILVYGITLYKRRGRKIGKSNIPTGFNKTGIYKGKIEIRLLKTGYSTITELRPVDFTAIVKEKNRYGDEIEVEYINLINTSKTHRVDIMSALKHKRGLIPLKDVEWKYDVADVLINRNELRVLLNTKTVKIGDIEIKLDNDIERTEILDIIIEETHE
jgi:hypothetical protein